MFWDLNATGLSTHEEQCFIYAVQGLVNQAAGSPGLLFNTGKADCKVVSFPCCFAQSPIRGAAQWRHAGSDYPVMIVFGAVDFPGSDRQWAQYLARHRGIAFNTTVPADACALLGHFGLLARPSVRYNNATDGYSIYIALTIAGIDGTASIGHASMPSLLCPATPRLALALCPSRAPRKPLPCSA